MSVFGFCYKALYRLEVDELWDIAHLIKGEKHYLSKDKAVLIRGVIIPFLRQVSKAPKDADKEQVMRSSLVRVAQILSIDCKNWETASNSWLVHQIRRKWSEAFRKRLESLDEDELQSILNRADKNLKNRAQEMGLTFIPTPRIVVGDLSGPSIYLETATGLEAISSAIGVTFPWAVYRGASSILGIMLGPIGWALAGGIVLLSQFLKRNDPKMTAVVIAIIIAIGDNPYEWFGFEENAQISEVNQVYRAMMKTFHPDSLSENLPDWMKHRFNELLLQTQENYDQIGKYQLKEAT